MKTTLFYLGLAFLLIINQLSGKAQADSKWLSQTIALVRRSVSLRRSIQGLWPI